MKKSIFMTLFISMMFATSAAFAECITCNSNDGGGGYTPTILDNVGFRASALAVGETLVDGSDHLEIETEVQSEGYALVDGTVGLEGGCDVPDCAKKTWKQSGSAGQYQGSVSKAKFDGPGAMLNVNRAMSGVDLEVFKK